MRAFVGASEQLKIGDLTNSDTMIGPIINSRQRQRIRDHIADALEHGAEIISGGNWTGNTCHPTILSGVDASMSCFAEETFGPVTAVSEFSSVDQGLALANSPGCGLNASVFTASLKNATTFAEQLQAGMVHINAATIQEEPHIPFGGVGTAGWGERARCYRATT